MVSRASKTRRAARSELPVHIRGVDDALETADREYAARKLETRLGKFARSVHRVTLRVEDINGPRGGVDKRCSIKVVLDGLPSVVVEERHQSSRAAIDVALERTVRAVRRGVQRRRANARAAAGGKSRP